MKLNSGIIILFIYLATQSILAMDAKPMQQSRESNYRWQCYKQIMTEKIFSSKNHILHDLCAEYSILECYFFLEAYFNNQEKLESQYNLLILSLRELDPPARLNLLYALIKQKNKVMSELLKIISYIWMQPGYESWQASEKPRVNIMPSLHQELNEAFLELKSYQDFENILIKISYAVIDLLRQNDIDASTFTNETNTTNIQQEKCIIQ